MDNRCTFHRGEQRCLRAKHDRHDGEHVFNLDTRTLAQADEIYRKLKERIKR